MQIDAAALADAQFMSRALVLARRGLRTVAPNPVVGCLLVRAGEIIGEGWHQRAGEAHAERAAIENAGDVRGATAYVTLEPCNHEGRTGACTEALIKAGVARVVAAMRDPNPLVSGAGLKRLKEAGIDVQCGLLQTDAARLNRGFCKRMQTGQPFVTVKLAASLDGQTAAADGSSQWITGEQARTDVQRLRAKACAIVTGVDTVLADDPSLTVRLPDTSRQPLRVALDSHWRTPVTARLIRDGGHTLIVGGDDTDDSVRRNTLRGSSVQMHSMPLENGRVPLAAVLKQLGEQGCNNVLVEAGAGLAGAFIDAGLCDELVVYNSPDSIGADGRGMALLPSVTTLKQRKCWKITDQRRVGRDTRTTLIPANDNQE